MNIRKWALPIIVIACFSLTGCVGSSGNYFLRKNQERLELKEGYGAMLLTFHASGVKTFTPYTLTVQEINQYKDFSKKPLKPITVQKLKTSGDIYLLNTTLPEGTYLINNIGGGLMYGTRFYIPSAKVCDITSGKVAYAGRLEALFGNQKFVYGQGHTYDTSLTVTDLYNEDIPLFKTEYPILQNERIDMDLLY
ncbi:MAG: hypothetical protein ISS26_06145 [Candidatus Omnitrophica bacterium]|nr:hypothetical protein [Candidatus Omnitrophota bacterium]